LLLQSLQAAQLLDRFTASGFKYWDLACLPDCIVAVPQSLWTSVMLALSNNVAPMFGLLGGLAAARGHSLHARITATLPNTPDSQLRMEPNAIFQIAQLRAINFKGGKFANAPAGALITPDIILETKSGKQSYGVHGPDFQKSCAQLRQMYPNLCKSI
jgi:hypothetical protein